MTISPLAAAALRVINAAWVNGTSYDLASQAAYALESAQMLQSPETAAEMEQLRARGAELEAETYVAPSPSCTRCYGADAVRFVDKGGATSPCRVCGPSEVERLRARVAELEHQVIGVRAVHTKYADSEHCQHDGQQWPCPTMQAVEVAPDEYPAALPWARLMDAEDRADFLDELAAAAITHADSATALGEVEDACGRWRAIAEAQHAHNTAPGPDPQEPEHPAPCRWPASPTCTCAGPVPYALTKQAARELAQPTVDRLRGILAPTRKAGA